MDVLMQPTRVDLEADDRVQLWECHAFGTRYRGMVVRVPSDPIDLFGADLLVAVEPAGGKQHLVPGRMWAPFSRDARGELAQTYVEEKFAVQGEDAAALTLLVAAMLDRKPAFRAE